MKNIIQRESGKTYVYLVRHGHFIIPKIGNDPHPPISKRGRMQARSVAKKFGSLKKEIDILYCSSMKRAIETAEEIEKTIKKKAIQSAGLWEFNKILWTKRYYHYKYWKHYRKHLLTIRTLNEILTKHKGKAIVIVAHGNVIKGILRNKNRLSREEVRNLEYKHCRVTCMKFNGIKLEETYCINAQRPTRLIR